MKRFIRCVSLILSITLILTTPAFAAEYATPKASSFFMCSSTYLVKLSTTQFKVWFEITATGTMDELGAKTIKVQRSSDGENWTTMKTYSSDDYYDTMICKNTAGHANCFTYSGTPGYYYRAQVTYYAKNGNNVGEVTEYSETLKL